MTQEKQWFVYLVQCANNALYCGVTNDLDKRMQAHISGKGSKYIKAKGFKELIAAKPCKNKIEAYQLEYQIKQVARSEKLEFFKDWNCHLQCQGL